MTANLMECCCIIKGYNYFVYYKGLDTYLSAVEVFVTLLIKN